VQSLAKNVAKMVNATLSEGFLIW